MSSSHHTNRVQQLGSQLATLRGQLADERKKLRDANSKARRSLESLNRATSPSQLSSKSREVERHEKAAADHEKKAAALEKKVVDKQKALSSAEANLDRARRDQDRKDQRDTERRRKADLDHIKRLEQARRQATSLPQQVAPRPVARTPARTQGSAFSETFDVCLSFAGEQRDYVERIAVALKSAGLKVFYDQDEDIAASLWGRDLGEALDYVYRQGSRFCLMFISADYAAKAWTRHERRSALARAIEQDEYVLPARFDDTELDGLRPTVAYLDLREIAPATLVDFVLKKFDLPNGTRAQSPSDPWAASAARSLVEAEPW